MQQMPPALFGSFAAIAIAWILAAVIGFGAFIFWIAEIVDVLRRQFREPTEKIVWLIVVLLLHFIGAVIYYFVGKKQGYLPGEPPLAT